RGPSSTRARRTAAWSGSPGLRTRRPPLAQDLPQRQGHTRRQIERADLPVEHGNGDQPVAPPLADLGSKPDTLLAEHQHRPFRVAHVPEAPRPLGAEEIRLAEIREPRFELRPGAPDAGIDPRPVVEAGPPHLALVQEEPERLDEMKPRPGSQARAPHIPCVPMDLRLDQRDVQAHDASV